MRTPSQLISLALGMTDPPSSSPLLLTSVETRFFRIYEVELPMPAFRGFPSTWHFAILETNAAQLTLAALLAEARAIIDGRSRQIPLALITDDPQLSLSDELTAANKHVFCLDSSTLPTQLRSETTPQLAPLVLCFRHVLDTKDPSLISFSPYQREKPVVGWRFFGRRRELNRLLYTNENYVLVGARRAGKTSLMLEVERLLKANKEQVFYVNVQHCSKPGDVVRELLRTISPRDATSAVRRSAALDEPLLSQILRTITAQSPRTTLLLDELGNVITNLPQEDWQFLGTLRKIAQQGRLRLILSCFQEVFLRQQSEFNGPLVNFAATMRLGLFSDAEVEELLLSPLDFWHPMEHNRRRQMLQHVLSVVGHHPYFLQYFCGRFFEDLLNPNTDSDSVTVVESLLRRGLVDCFADPVDEVFFRIPSASIRCLFLKRCLAADSANEELRRAEITEEWIDQTLLGMGYKSTFSGRRSLLEGFQVHGLTSSVQGNPAVQSVASPIIYLFVKRTVASVEELTKKLQADMHREIAIWQLSPAEGGD